MSQKQHTPTTKGPKKIITIQHLDGLLVSALILNLLLLMLLLLFIYLFIICILLLLLLLLLLVFITYCFYSSHGEHIQYSTKAPT